MRDELQHGLDYTFHSKNLLRQALTHSSFVYEQKLSPADSNERLEFLGDAVIELCISDFLYHKFPDLSEGQLTQHRAKLVCEESLAGIARSLGMGSFLLLGQGEAQENGREKPSILSDALEAVLGAIFLDGGLDDVKIVITRLFEPILGKTIKQNKDNKSSLQELLQKDSRDTAQYEIINEEGPPHSKTFTSQVSHQGKVLGVGVGKSKKEAEQNAAKVAIEKAAQPHSTV